MKLFNSILKLISVPKCACCKTRLSLNERVLCQRCRLEYEEQKDRNCSLCSLPLSACKCSNTFLKAHSVKVLFKVYRYSREPEFLAGNSLIYSLKQDNRRDVKELLSEELIKVIAPSINQEKLEEYLITSVPRRKEGLVKFGYDHARDLATLVAKALGIEYKQLLISLSRKAQKETAGRDRILNARFDYKVGKNYSLKGKRVIIIDDIITTGASMGSCASLIQGLYAKEVIGAAIAIAYKDNF